MKANHKPQSDAAHGQSGVSKAAKRREREHRFDLGIRRNRRKRQVRMRKLFRLADKIGSKMHN